VDSRIGEHLGDFVVDRMHQMKANAPRRESVTGDLQCGGIAIDADDREIGEGSKCVLAMPTEADGCVDEHRTRARQGRCQQREDALA